MVSRRVVAAWPNSLEVRSFRCWGVSPSGPPPAPLLKERIAASTWSLETMTLSSLDGGSGGFLGSIGGGCFLEFWGDILYQKLISK